MALTLASSGQGGVFTLRAGSFGGRLQASVTPPFSIDSDAQAFYDRVTTAGGTLSATEQTAINTLTLSLKAAGIWTLMKAIYPMVGASAAACAQNLKSSSFTGTFNGAWSFNSTGVTGNATNTYIRTGFIPTAQLTAGYWHQSYYSRTNNTIGSDAGTGDVAGYPSTYFQIRNPSNASYFVCGNFTNYGLVASGVTDARGFFLGSILSNTDRTYYRNSSILLTNTTSITNILYPSEITVGAYNENGINPRYFNSKECALYTIGDGLNNTQASDFYTAVQAFQTTLLRQV